MRSTLTARSARINRFTLSWDSRNKVTGSWRKVELASLALRGNGGLCWPDFFKSHLKYASELSVGGRFTALSSPNRL